MNRTCFSCDRSEYAKGLCLSCYRKAHRRLKKGLTSATDNLPPKVPAKCHPKEKHYANGLCRSCWRKAEYKKKKGQKAVVTGIWPDEVEMKTMTAVQVKELADRFTDFAHSYWDLLKKVLDAKLDEQEFTEDDLPKVAAG